MFKIRLVAISILLAFSASSCKKVIRDQKEQYVLNVLTSGRWFLENYTENGVDNTYDFIAYEFQFYEDYKLDAITATTTQKGTWTPDPSKLTMTIQFTTGDPALQRVSYPWFFTDSHVGLVFAETTTASGKITIRLRKKS